MDEKLRQQAQNIFDAYNLAISDIYDKMLDQVTDEAVLSSASFEDYIKTSAGEKLQAWCTQSLDGLKTDTPEQFFSSLTTLDDTLDVFCLAARTIDADMPEALILRMASFGEPMRQALQALALSMPWSKEDPQKESSFRDDLAPAMLALHVLGKWAYQPALPAVLERYTHLTPPDELVSDYVLLYLSLLGEPAIWPIMACFHEPRDERLGGAYETLMVALTQIGQSHPSDEIYLCLKSIFRRADPKVMATACLGDYGDGRAVPLLKGYLDRTKATIDRTLFYEILTSVQKLGGDIADVKGPFPSMM